MHHRLIDILEEFPSFTGLEANRPKSSVTFSKVYEDKLELQNMLGFQVKTLPIMYLGPNLEEKKSYNQYWKLIQPNENF